MLPFKNRLVKRRDFESVARFGSFFSFGNIALKVMDNKSKDSRIGISVGIRFSKKAVERNTAKRQIREIMRRELSRIKKGYDLVISIRKREGERIKEEKLEEMIKTVLKSAKLIE